jgi:hypothetical protein
MVEHRELSQGRALELAPNFSPVVPMELTCQSSLPRDFPGESQRRPLRSKAVNQADGAVGEG